MTNTAATIAEAFSRHRFAETYPHLAADVRWTAVGQATMDGRDEVVAACEAATTEMAGTTVEFTRFVSIAGPDAAAVDVVARYADPDGGVSVVSSCDIYEFADDLLVAITSYAVELPSG
jgi:hypothetical protein